MITNTMEKSGSKKEALLTNSFSLDLPIPNAGLTKKRAYRIRRLALPYIRAHKVKKGEKEYTFYTYCRGVDKEVYLGDADTILQAVKGKARG